ncbi:hypothetical protein PANT_3c00077 [Moesziomyces antarcticus T-34]|uniref:Uncharacterized protein n=1 Tax=Pseudozyma antarctica (strain T-34) TaxID=1151754 RepID=M9LJN4_PSEA3|nr:hypothetical protein PANT_3c00077 [Moesziomyces antarcticus T-34]
MRQGELQAIEALRKCRRRHLHRHHIIYLTLAISQSSASSGARLIDAASPTLSAHRSDPSAVFGSAHLRICRLDSTSERILVQHSSLTPSITSDALHPLPTSGSGPPSSS